MAVKSDMMDSKDLFRVDIASTILVFIDDTYYKGECGLWRIPPRLRRRNREFEPTG